MIKKFELEFAEFCGCKFALTTVNGSVALRIVLIAAGVKPGDEVIIPPYTFIATASIVLEANCVPVFVDIDPETYNIDPKKIEQAILAAAEKISVVARGAGSGVAGEALCSGIVFDMTRYMNKIIGIEDDGERVVCEPGVVLDDLNRYLADIFYTNLYFEVFTYSRIFWNPSNIFYNEVR